MQDFVVVTSIVCFTCKSKTKRMVCLLSLFHNHMYVRYGFWEILRCYIFYGWRCGSFKEGLKYSLKCLWTTGNTIICRNHTFLYIDCCFPTFRHKLDVMDQCSRKTG
eukprot:c26099_g1_i1 orf=903-1223(+)